MSGINDHLLAESEKYISELLSQKLPKKIIYHNLNHALLVKKYAETIGETCNFTSGEMNLLRICALFHDVGYVNSYEKSKEEGIKITREFLEKHQVDHQTIDQVSEIIEATKIPQNPKDKIAEVLCDADQMYIATENGLEQFELLLEETSREKLNFGKRSAFEKESIHFFAEHRYFTEYGKTILQPKKEAATERIVEQLKQRKLMESKKEIADKRSIAYSRGVETLFRLTARNQINLNSIADNKSNILISVNAIIISIIITMLAGNVGNLTQNIVPIIFFLIICLITIVLAILSTRPNIVVDDFTEEDVKQNKVDLIFFGNFINMKYDDYHKAVMTMIEDDEYLYSTMIKNQYSLGKILAKKFRLLKIAYNVFMIGIILTVIVFLLTILNS